MGAVVKENVGELYNEVREGFSRRPRKELTGVVQGVSGKRRFLVMGGEDTEDGSTKKLFRAKPNTTWDN